MSLRPSIRGPSASSSLALRLSTLLLGSSSFQSNMLFCPVTIARLSVPSNVTAGFHAKRLMPDWSLTILHRRGRMAVYGSAGDDLRKRMSNTSVLLDVGEADVATRNRPLGEKTKCSTPMSLTVLLPALMPRDPLLPFLRAAPLAEPVR